MSAYRLAFILGSVCFAALLLGATDEKPAPRKGQEREIEQLIAKLGSEQTDERKAASDALDKIGERALPALHNALQSNDAEIKRAAGELLQAIHGRLAKEALATIKKRDGQIAGIPDIGDGVARISYPNKEKAEDDDLRYFKYLAEVGVNIPNFKYVDKVGVIDLNGCPITDAGLLHLKGMSSLRELHLANTKITDVGLRVLTTMPKLQRLSLENTKVTDAGLVSLRDLTGLQRVGLPLTITDKGLAHFDRLVNLDSFCLSHNKNVTGEGLKHLKDAGNLRSLELDNSSVTDDGLASLRHLKRLEKLHMSRTSVSDAALAHLKDAHSLKLLWLFDTKVTGSGLTHLKTLQKMEELRFRGSPLTDEGLAHLKECKSLIRLDLAGTLVTDEGLTHLKGLVNLKGVGLDATFVTEQGMAELRKALPKTIISGDRLRRPEP